MCPDLRAVLEAQCGATAKRTHAAHGFLPSLFRLQVKGKGSQTLCTALN